MWLWVGRGRGLPYMVWQREKATLIAPSGSVSARFVINPFFLHFKIFFYIYEHFFPHCTVFSGRFGPPCYLSYPHWNGYAQLKFFLQLENRIRFIIFTPPNPSPHQALVTSFFKFFFDLLLPYCISFHGKSECKDQFLSARGHGSSRSRSFTAHWWCASPDGLKKPFI